MSSRAQAVVRSLVAASTLVGALAFCMPAAQSAPSLGTDNIQAIKGSKRVAIERFDAEFYTQIFASARGSIQVTSNLKGVSDATMQALTERAYAQTVQALQAAGFEVVDLPTLAAQPLFQELETKYGHDAPWINEQSELMAGGKQVSTTFAPAGRKAHFDSGMARGDFKQRTESQNYAIGKQQGELAKALDATLLQVHVLAGFGSTEATKSGSMLRSFAQLGGKASVAAQPVLAAEETQIQIVNASGSRTFGASHRMGHSGAVYLKAPIVSADQIFSITDGGIVTATSEEAYTATYDALIKETLDAMVAALGGAR